MSKRAKARAARSSSVGSRGVDGRDGRSVVAAPGSRNGEAVATPFGTTGEVMVTTGGIFGGDGLTEGVRCSVGVCRLIEGTVNNCRPFPPARADDGRQRTITFGTRLAEVQLTSRVNQ